ncbi:MAG: insulinase family protein [Clostridiales bacterium]|nr:insulinase family protein [Clostridiales bacterium]
MTVKKYESGLTVIVEQNSALRSVTAGIMVGTGSAYETRENNGISHFIEHMQFKGTTTRTANDIVSQFDREGAVYNAFTGKENTCFYFKSIDERVEQCFDILCDLFLNSTFEQAELDRERKVILEEINMSQDEPDGVCYDVLYSTAFKDGSLGMEILGTKDNVKRFNKPDILEYKKHNYLPSNTAVAFVGNITEAAALSLVEKYMPSLINAPFVTPRKQTEQPIYDGYGEAIHDYEQSEISIAFPSITLGDPRSATQSALDCILGSGMSSRLFQKLREQMGLVYSVYTSPWLGATNGMFSVCANVNVKNVTGAVQAIRAEIDRLVKDGVTDEETEKAKTQLKVNAMFGKENPMNYMLALMRRRVILGIDYDLDELLSRIEKITASDINALAREIFARPAIFAYAGKKPPEKIDEIYNRG